MSLSIAKLNNFLEKNDMIPKKFFTIKKSIVFIEVFSISTSDNFILYVPSKYDIEVKEDNNVYEIQNIEIPENGDIPQDYGENVNDIDIEKDYNTGVFLESNEYKDDIEEQLKEDYNHPVNMNNNDTKQLREVFRQLKRFKFCIQNLKYKLCIIYKNYLCCIHRSDAFQCYFVSKLKEPTQTKLLVSIDLESLYKKTDTISSDIKTIQEAIYQVLEKNQTKHIHNLQKMLEHKNNLVSFSDKILIKKQQYIDYISQLEKLLEKINISEQKSKNKLQELENKYNIEKNRGIYIDIEKSHQKNNYEKELYHINIVKKEIIDNILVFRSKYEDLSLKIDKICFDNIVMLNTIITNFISLSQI